MSGCEVTVRSKVRNGPIQEHSHSRSDPVLHYILRAFWSIATIKVGSKLGEPLYGISGTNIDNRKTPIGVVNRLIWVKIPSGLLALDVTVTGGKMSSGLKRIGHYLMHENHPIVMVCYDAISHTRLSINMPQ